MSVLFPYVLCSDQANDAWSAVKWSMTESARSTTSRDTGGRINVQNKSLLNLLDDKNEKDMDGSEENAPGEDLCTFL